MSKKFKTFLDCWNAVPTENRGEVRQKIIDKFQWKPNVVMRNFYNKNNPKRIWKREHAEIIRDIFAEYGIEWCWDNEYIYIKYDNATVD